MPFNPDKWLTSAFNLLEDAVKSAVNGYVLDNTNADAGLQVYEISMDWPSAAESATFVPMDKTIIHFVIDEINSEKLGIGPNEVAIRVVEPTPAPGPVGTITSEHGRVHLLNFDVGIWASDKSGGSSNRLEAWEMLDKLFNPWRNIRFADGVEIIHYNGGRFVTETINDVRVFRTVGSELVVRVYSRDLGDPDVIVEGVDQAPELVIDTTVPLT